MDVRGLIVGLAVGAVLGVGAAHAQDKYQDKYPDWPESYCHVDNKRVVLGDETYRLSDDGLLMPVRKDQPPPDLRYFQTKK